jgi:hypothetical protein
MRDQMTHYALLFHFARALTPEELKQRALDIGVWVQHVTALGITLDPRNFEAPEATFTLQGNHVVAHSAPADPSLTNIVFFDAESKEQALNIARIHPGLEYGATLELREWLSPREAAIKRSAK